MKPRVWIALGLGLVVQACASVPWLDLRSSRGQAEDVARQYYSALAAGDLESLVALTAQADARPYMVNALAFYRSRGGHVEEVPAQWYPIDDRARLFVLRVDVRPVNGPPFVDSFRFALDPKLTLLEVESLVERRRPVATNAPERA